MYFNIGNGHDWCPGKCRSSSGSTLSVRSTIGAPSLCNLQLQVFIPLYSNLYDDCSHIEDVRLLFVHILLKEVRKKSIFSFLGVLNFKDFFFLSVHSQHFWGA